MHLNGLRQCDPKYGIIITKTQDYYKLKNNFNRELNMLQNCVFIFLKFFIDFKEIANDIITAMT